MRPRIHPALAVSLLIATGAAPPIVALAGTDPYDTARLAEMKTRYPENAEAVDAGGRIFKKRCAGCHGDDGAGDGGGAPYMDPRPRDFTMGLFKFRSTKSGELPTDEDLFRTISRGVPGTAMPAWGEGPFQLGERERWQLVYYVKQLGGEDFGDPDFDPYAQILPLSEPPAVTPERIAAGRDIFSAENKGGCIKCHGPSGRGNGPEAGTQVDDWGDPILPADLTKGWRYKNGNTPREIFRTLSTGLNGTPMPGYGETLSDEERWDLAYFVHSLIEPRDTAGDQVLVAHRRESLPEDPRDAVWTTTPGIAIPLLGQVIRPPRHANPAVDEVTVRALYNEDEIAFRLSWNDRTRSITHEPSDIGTLDDTYAPASLIWSRRSHPLRDSLQMQFPADSTESSRLPYFYLGGGGGGPVALWRWFAEREASHAKYAFEEWQQNGADRPAKSRPEDEQSLSGKSSYDDGRWMLVIRRPHPVGRKRDVTFAEGAFVPFALHVWDGGNGEDGPLRAISSWYWLLLEAPIPRTAYLAALAGFGGMQVFMLISVGFARRSARRAGRSVATASGGAASVR